MFDEIFTYSQSISSSCRNSLVSGRKGKRGRRAHTELSYFVSFFPSDNILCSFFFCCCSPAKVSCPRHSCACLCFFPGKHRWHSWCEAESHGAACSVDTLCVWTGSGPPCGNKVGRTLYVDIRCKKCPLKQVGLPLESLSEKCYSCSFSALFYFLLRQHETILDLLVETVPQIKGFWRDVVNFGVVMLLTDSSTSWHRSSNKHCQISSLHCVDYVPFKNACRFTTCNILEDASCRWVRLPLRTKPLWTSLDQKRMTCGFGSVTSADVMLSGSFRENIQFKNQQLVICPLNLSYKISLFFKISYLCV